MRRTVLSTVAAVLGLAAVLVAAPAQALGTPQRPGGSVLTDLVSTNGGDNGWGNCGGNSSGGVKPTTEDGKKGNGGNKPWDSCITADPYPATSTTTTSTTTVDPYTDVYSNV